MIKLRSNLMLLITTLIWGTAFVAQNVGMNYVGPFTFNSLRFFIGGIVLIPCIMLVDKLNKKKFSFWGTADKKIRKYLIISSLSCGAVLSIASTLQQIGIKYTTVGKASFITALYIIIVPILGIFMKKRVAAVVWVSAGIALIGTFILSVSENLTLELGDMLILLCAFAFSAQIMIVDKFAPMVDPLRLSCGQFWVCGIIGAVPMFFEKPSFEGICSAWLPLLYVGVFSCGVAYTFQIIAQKNLNPFVSSLIFSLESIFGAFSGWLILGDTLSAKELFGCFLVFCAIVLAQIPSKKKKD